MSNRQLPPRDSTGRFRDVVTENATAMNEEQTIGVLSADDVSDSTEFVNVTISLLEEAIQQTRQYSDMVRIAVRSREWTDENGETHELGVVLLKGSPSDEEVVGLAGRERVFNDE